LKLGKIFKIFKKGSKMAASGQGGGAVSEFDWPSGTRIAVYGHANCGKTVFFTVLNEDCKVSRDLQISVTDNATAGEFLSNYRAIWGIGETSTVGTVVDLKEEKRFPDNTAGDRVLQFNAIMDGDKVPIVAYDYDGRAVAIGEPHQLTDKVIDFVSGANGILFFFDPKALGSELQCQAHCASFVNMLERLAPVTKRLDIPVGLVITKADVLPGFKDDSQAVLIPAEEESILAENYESFLEKVLASNRINSDSNWAGSVREVLVKLKEFLKVTVGRTLDFQVFFVSSTGQAPVKIGTDVGRSVYAPPDKITPVGVREPFRWVLKSIGRSRGLSRFRALAKYAAILGLLWIVGISIPYAYHFWWVLGRVEAVERDVVATYGGSAANIPATERARISSRYGRYETSFLAKYMFTDFVAPARSIKIHYSKYDLAKAKANLDEAIGRLTTIVSDSAMWPKPNYKKDSLILQEMHVNLAAELESFHVGGDESELYRRSDRALIYWDLFKATRLQPDDQTAWQQMVDKVNEDRSLYANDLSKAENTLGDALLGAKVVKEIKEEKKKVVAQAGGKFETLVAKIKSSSDPNYLLVRAVRELKAIRSDLAGNPAREADVLRIDSYLKDVKQFEKRNSYTFTVTNIPDGHHLHVIVKQGGKDANYPTKQYFKGRGGTIRWKMGDHIIVAIDANNHDGGGEKWGEVAKSTQVFDGKVALFDLETGVTFDSGDKVSLSFEDDIRGELPSF